MQIKYMENALPLLHVGIFVSLRSCPLH